MRFPACRAGRLCAGLLLVLPAIAEAQTLPPPSGLYPVGTTWWRPSGGRAGGSLPAAAQLFYPAAAASGEPAPYLPDPGLAEALVAAEYFLQPPEVLRAWDAMRIAARGDASPAVSRRPRPFPLVVVSPGLGVSRTQYTALAMELASHGFVVSTVDHAPGGFRVDEGGAPERDSLPDLDHPDAIDALARRWAAQSTGLVELLLRAEPGTMIGRVMSTVDTLAIGALGHSLGGAAAWAACRASRRFRACAGLDGTLTPSSLREGFAAPTLVLQSEPVYSDADLAAAGRTRARWSALGAEMEPQWAAALAARPAVPVYRFGLRGFGHLSASDAPFVMPGAITYFGGRMTGAARSHEIVSTYVRGFFDRALRDYPAGLLDIEPPFAEVERR